jgi:hypothetical protein
MPLTVSWAPTGPASSPRVARGLKAIHTRAGSVLMSKGDAIQAILR